MDPAELIRTVRERRRLTQTELARRAGTTQTAISRLETGGRSPSTETLRRLLQVMGEDLELRARPLRGDHDPAHLRAERQLTPAQRLERAFAWMRLNAAVRAGARAAAPKASASARRSNAGARTGRWNASASARRSNAGARTGRSNAKARHR